MIKLDTVVYAGVAFAGAALLFTLARRSGVLPLNGDAERMSGVQHLYAANTGQQAATSASIAASWRELQDSVFKTQPDFWV
jgi:hypothetical protein